ncbi:dynein heavy chain binding protein [Aureococcus anophagefferens]|nr:dynein heavy chain binding protein [Aureococcus anophagefferens]
MPREAVEARQKALEEKRRRIEALKAQKAERAKAATAQASAATKSFKAEPADVRPSLSQGTQTEAPPDADGAEAAAAEAASGRLAAAAEARAQAHAVSDEAAKATRRFGDAESKANVVDEALVMASLAKTSRLVERCLGERRVFDALAVADVADASAARDGRAAAFADEPLAVFSAPEAGLCLTGVCWAPHAPDLLACAYAKPAGGTVDGYDGAVRLWSHARHATPDATFACQSPVTCVAFDEANPSLVLGGTSSGQVVLWDVRSPSTLPTMRSPLDAAAPHGRPVAKLRARGDAVLTVSADGAVCYWSSSQLQRPIEAHALKCGSATVAASAVDFADPAVDDRDVYVGCEEGKVYRAKCGGGDEGGAGRCRVLDDRGAPHVGLVTAVASAASRRDARAPALGLRRGLVASSSVDWTAKLWCGGALLASLDHGNHAYVTDACWAPKRAALLATASSSGDVAVWSAAATRGGGRVAPARAVSDGPLTALAFADDSRRLAVGDAYGAATVLALAPDLVAPDAAEDARLDEVLAALQPRASS